MQECVEALQSFRDRESLLSFTSTRGVVGGGGDIADRAAPALAAEGEEEQGGLSAAEGLLPLQQLLLREYSGTRPNISESHSEISTRVPFCIGSPRGSRCDSAYLPCGSLRDRTASFVGVQRDRALRPCNATRGSSLPPL